MSTVMGEDDDHSRCVTAWLERSGTGQSPERLLHAFERGFAAVWRRAHQTLGDVTLMAIVDRVLYVAAESHPMLSGLQVDATGLRAQELRERVAGLDHGHLAEAVRFVMVELLTILGNLTAEILTTALHAELAKVPGEGDRNGSRRGSPNPAIDRGEGPES